MLSDNWLQLIQPVISVKFTGHSLIHIWKRCHWVVTDIKEALQRELDFFQYVDRVQVYLRHYVAKLWLKKEKRMIGPVCWEWVLREERLRKGRWEVERHLMALHDACFWNELWKCIQPLLEITTVSHKGAANRANLSGTSHCSQSWTRALITRGEKQGHPMPRWEVHLVFALIQVESVYIHMGRSSFRLTVFLDWPVLKELT